MARKYDNLQRRGINSSTSVNPRMVLEDIDEKIRMFEPNDTPLVTLANYMGAGKPPTNHKIQQMLYYGFDEYDYCSKAVFHSGADARMAILTIDQVTRLTTRNQMYYQPQEAFRIIETDQVVEIIMTPDDSLRTGMGPNQKLSLPISITGGTATTTAPGTVLVKNVEDAPLIPFKTATVLLLGKTLFESQDIEGVGTERDLTFTFNYVEHKEKILTMTQDQKEWIKNKKGVMDFNFLQKETIKEFKRDVENTWIFGKRAFDGMVKGRPKRRMMGLLEAIETNVSYYNPFAAGLNFEKVLYNWCTEQAFASCPNGQNKIALCGSKFLAMFNQTFASLRRADSLMLKGDVGVDLDTYVLPGNYRLTLLKTSHFKKNTPMDYWCVVIDPKQMDLRVARNFATKPYSLANERDYKLMMEWQGSIAWNLENTMAILRTTGR